jgi:hypothetical protein
MAGRRSLPSPAFYDMIPLMQALKVLAKPAGIVLGIFLGIFVFFGLAVTYSTQHGDLQAKFLQGKAPAVLPDGAHRGTVPGYAGNWYGKEFDRMKKTGINLFGNGASLTKNYPFTVYPAKGLRDTQVDVLRIDYNLPENPAWLRLVTDEIVQVGPDEYLGKLHFRFIPGYPFALGFFELKKT